MTLTRRTFIAGAAMAASSASHARADNTAMTLSGRIDPPAGFLREAAPVGSFAAWLRALKLKPADAPVLLYTGAVKARQDVHAAIIDLDVGTRDLQQCADAVMRLRAEWLYAAGRAREVAFNDTGAGKPMPFSRWAEGERPRAEGRGLVWAKAAAADQSYASFRRYLDSVFTWAGTYSLERELVRVSARDVQAGDVVIRGGFPGHAVLVVDVAAHPVTRERRVLLAQSFMPAQSIHVLKNLSATDGTPWYGLEDAKPVETPEWLFPPDSLKRWR